jgi:hypothetical protein
MYGMPPAKTNIQRLERHCASAHRVAAFNGGRPLLAHTELMPFPLPHQSFVHVTYTHIRTDRRLLLNAEGICAACLGASSLRRPLHVHVATSITCCRSHAHTHVPGKMHFAGTHIHTYTHTHTDTRMRAYARNTGAQRSPPPYMDQKAEVAGGMW